MPRPKEDKRQVHPYPGPESECHQATSPPTPGTRSLWGPPAAIRGLLPEAGPRAGRSSRASSSDTSNDARCPAGRPPGETDLTSRGSRGAPRSYPHSQTLTAPGPEGPPASSLTGITAPAQLSPAWGRPRPKPRPQPSTPLPALGIWSPRVSVSAAPLFPPGPAAGQQARKGACSVLHRLPQRRRDH